jgi:predicted metal-dependent phosphotriesterase family hydrolase
MHSKFSRKQFLQASVAAVASAMGADADAAQRKRTKGMIQTVTGTISARDFGFALIHEHILCDFIGADKTGRDRWNVDEVVRTIKPLLLQVKERGVRSFVDCTPAYIGRDPRILKILAQETGLNILINTGYYGGAGDKYVPKHAYDETAEQLADRWIREAQDGIEGTGVKPGFIKIGVDATGDPASPLSEIDAKIVRAAARASREAGIAVTCHTEGGGPPGLAAVKLFAKEKGDPAKFIVAHSDGNPDAINLEVAERGAWVSFDGIGWRPLEEHLKLIATMLEKRPDRLLISQDAGWYWVGWRQNPRLQFSCGQVPARLEARRHNRRHHSPPDRRKPR